MGFKESLEKGRARASELANSWEPEGPLNFDRLNDLVRDEANQIIDHYDRQVEELFKVTQPHMRSYLPNYFDELEVFKSQHYSGKEPQELGEWWFFPWRQAVVHLMSGSEHTVMRTARNKSLITEAEQQKLATSSVAVGGLSVGSNVISALAMLGPWKLLKIADADILDPSNMNRILSSVADIGIEKTVKAARQIKEIDPNMNVELFRQGVSDTNIEDFLSGVDVVVDEMDDIRVKALIRLAAREKGIPVVMATDAGNNTIMDIERYDLDSSLPLFHGRLDEADLSDLLKERPTPARWADLAMKIIGAEHAEPRVLESLKHFQEGKIAGIPQIGPSAMQAGAITAFAVRQIITGEKVKTGKIGIDIVNQIIEGLQVLPAEEPS